MGAKSSDGIENPVFPALDTGELESSESIHTTPAPHHNNQPDTRRGGQEKPKEREAPEGYHR